jgi:hypothetical protein
MATVHRDLIFGGCFAFMRHELWPLLKEYKQQQSHHSISLDKHKTQKQHAAFVTNLFSASMATVLSSPINYVRNIHYATPPNTPPESTAKILRDLVSSAWKESTWLMKWYFIQSRLRLGWGTARVGCGMAFSAKIYDLCSRGYSDRKVNS